MQHYQVPSAEYSSYIIHVISPRLADDYMAQLRASCSPNSTPSLRAAIDQACRHLSGLVDDLQPVPVSVPGVHSLETLGQHNGAPVPAAVSLAAAMPNTPEEEARITQGIHARHAAAKPQNTVQAEKSAAKLWKVGTAWPLVPLFTAVNNALYAFRTHATHTHPTLQRYCEQEATLMATSCLRPKSLSSQCGLWMRQCSRMGLATHTAAWGERPLHCCV